MSSQLGFWAMLLLVCGLFGIPAFFLLKGKIQNGKLSWTDWLSAGIGIVLLLMLMNWDAFINAHFVFQILLFCFFIWLMIVFNFVMTNKFFRKHWLMTATITIFVMILLTRLMILLTPDLREIAGFEDAADLNGLEKFFHGILMSLQTFSMDADYLSVINALKQAMMQYNPTLSSSFISAFSFLAVSMNFLAPVIGMGIIIDFVSGFFPIWAVRFHFLRPKIVFSSLNKNSITLAEDIYQNGPGTLFDFCHLYVEKKEGQEADKGSRNKRSDNSVSYRHWEGKLTRFFWRWRRPMLIFTDTYPDSSSELTSELMDRAESIKAYCVRNDLTALNLKRSKAVVYILLDNMQETEIETLTALLEGRPLSASEMLEPAVQNFPQVIDKSKNFFNLFRSGEEKKPLTRTKVYIFINDPSCTSRLKQLLEHSQKNMKGNGDSRKKCSVPAVIVESIYDYRIVAAGLMERIPLFLPLLLSESKEKPSESSVSAHSESQSFTDNPSTSETEEATSGGQTGSFVKSEKDLNILILGTGLYAREILKAVFWSGQMENTRMKITVAGKNVDKMKSMLWQQSPGMMKDLSKEKNNIYVKSCEFVELDDLTAMDFREADSLFNEDSLLLDIHYVVIALGNDAVNSEVAAQMSYRIHQANLRNNKGNSPYQVIVPILYETSYSQGLLRSDPDPWQPYILPYGSFKQRFCVSTITYQQYLADKRETGNRYDRVSKRYSDLKNGNTPSSDDNQDEKTPNREADPIQSEYMNWADLAKLIHADYKLYDCSLLKGASFSDNQCELTVDDAKCSALHADERYKEFLSHVSRLEHKRWNAYQLADGFQTMLPETYTALAWNAERNRISENKSVKYPTKNIPLQFHMCIQDQNHKKQWGETIEELYHTVQAVEQVRKEKGGSIDLKELYKKEIQERNIVLDGLDLVGYLDLLNSRNRPYSDFESLQKELYSVIYGQEIYFENIEEFSKFACCFDYKLHDHPFEDPRLERKMEFQFENPVDARWELINGDNKS